MGSGLETILLAMTPINELRGTIPLAIGVLQLHPLKAFILACLGNMIPIFFLLWFWKHLAEYLMKKNKTVKKLFNWIFNRTRKRFYKKYSVYGDVALILFVAIPLPFTGAWTGSVAAFLFNIPYVKSLYLISIGVAIAGLIVTLGTIGVLSIV